MTAGPFPRTPGARLEGRGLTRRFGGRTAVDRVDVVVEPGRVSALIGPNGAGKTTLFGCLTGTERPDGGRVLLDGRDVTRLSADARARRGVGRTFQRLAVFGSLTVAENLLVAAENRSTGRRALAVTGLLGWGLLGGRLVGGPARDPVVPETLHRLGLTELADAPVAGLPTGRLRMVELGRALCHRPRVLLLDEPAAGLDQAEAAALRAVLRDVAASGVGVLVVEHDVALVFDVADLVYAMAEGRLVAAGPPARVRADPAVRATYLDPVSSSGTGSTAPRSS